jgi:ATP-binding cassette, subfamily A (ABC1), member 3
MDAEAKRLFWNDIIKLTNSNNLNNNRLIILTSLDECEQLCNKICIMKNGLFKCLGSPSYLKSKYGNGYKLIIKLLNNQKEKEKEKEDGINLIKFIKETFNESKLNEKQNNQYEFTIKFNSITLSKLFGILERNKQLLIII